MTTEETTHRILPSAPPETEEIANTRHMDYTIKISWTGTETVVSFLLPKTHAPADSYILSENEIKLPNDFLTGLASMSNSHLLKTKISDFEERHKAWANNPSKYGAVPHEIIGLQNDRTWSDVRNVYWVAPDNATEATHGKIAFGVPNMVFETDKWVLKLSGFQQVIRTAQWDDAEGVQTLVELLNESSILQIEAALINDAQWRAAMRAEEGRIQREEASLQKRAEDLALRTAATPLKSLNIRRIMMILRELDREPNAIFYAGKVSHCNLVIDSRKKRVGEVAEFNWRRDTTTAQKRELANTINRKLNAYNMGAVLLTNGNILIGHSEEFVRDHLMALLRTVNWSAIIEF